MWLPFLDSSFEERYRAICDLAFTGSAEFMEGFRDKPEALFESENRLAFLRAVHKGFAAAQAEVTTELLQLGKVARDSPERQTELALRKIADAIAWQMIGHQLYIARRLYREQSPPSLQHSNFKSVAAVVADMQARDYSNFVLMSDLTTFVQVGDLLVRDPAGVLTVAEVKEGDVNAKISEFLDSYAETQCSYSLQLFREREGKKAFDQLRRMARQAGRMSHVAEIVNEDRSVDPDSNLQIRVNEQPFLTESYDPVLDHLLDESEKRGWAIDVIDDCLYVGVYSGRSMVIRGREVFEAWIKGCGLRPKNPISNILEAMVHPLALPLFNRQLQVKHIFDLLFGRKAIVFAVHIDAFMEKATACGVPMRWSSRKAAAKMRADFGATKIDHRVPLIGQGDQLRAMGDGVIYRILFHGMSPISAIESLRQGGG